MKTRRDPAAKAGSLLFALFAQFIINRKRGWWKAFLDSTGRGLLGYSRPVAFSKCRLAHFYGKIAAVGWHFTCPPGAMEEVFHVFTAPDQRFLPILLSACGIVPLPSSRIFLRAEYLPSGLCCTSAP